MELAMPDRLRSWLTRRFAWAWGGVTSVDDQETRGVSRTVYWFNSEGNRLGGATPFGTILLNERLRREFSEAAQEYVFLHEVGHHRVPGPLRQLAIPAYVLAGFVLLGGVLTLPRNIGIAMRHASSILEGIVFLSVALLIGVAAALPFVILSWTDEAFAELYAISLIGIDRYERVREEMAKARDGRLIHRLRLRVQYPPRTLVLWLARRRGVRDGEADRTGPKTVRDDETRSEH